MPAIFWNPQERRLRSLWRLVAHLLIVAAIAAAPVISLIETLADRHKAGAFLPGLSHQMFDKAMDFIAGPLLTVMIVVSVAFAGRFIDRRRWRDFGLTLDREWRSDFLFGLELGAVLIVLVYAAESAAGWVSLEPRMVPGMAGVPVSLLWTFIVVKALCVAPSEELVSRGYQLKNLAEGFNGIFGLSNRGAAVFAALVTSLGFAALHFTTENFDATSFAGLAINGVLLAAPVLLTGRLGMSIGIHMAWNLTQGGVFGFPVSGDVENISFFTAHVTGPVDWTGGAYGPEGGYLGWLAAVVGIGLILLRVRLRSGKVGVLPEISQYQPR